MSGTAVEDAHKIGRAPVGEEDVPDTTWNKARIRMSELVDMLGEIRSQAMHAAQKLKGPPDKNDSAERENTPDSGNFQEALNIDLGRAEKFAMEIRELLTHIAE